ncbi:spore germination protein [Peribacillus butanolivorans]|uniref:hypothetical protein n=1 Tax=Peribacillus butanolivorans TaxID=421767 RepID=UPI0030C9EBC4
MENSSDFITYTHNQSEYPYIFAYFNTIVEHIFPDLKIRHNTSLTDLQAKIPIENIMITSDQQNIETKLLQGHVIIQLGSNEESCLLVVGVQSVKSQQISTPENEYSVLGP